MNGRRRTVERVPRAPQRRRPGARRHGGARAHVPSDERRPQILKAAAELFAARGFAGTTTRQIAAGVGTSETVLFRHFPTKESLYTAILEQQAPSADFERWLERLRALADERDDQGLFGAVATAVLESYRTNPVYHRLMLFAALENHELARLAHVKYTLPIASFLREYVSRRQAEGAFRRVRAEAVVQMLFGVIAHFGLWKTLGSNPLGLTEAEVTAQMLALLEGLRAEPSPSPARQPHAK